MFVYVVYSASGILSIVVGGVFTFYQLWTSSRFVCVAFYKGSSCVPSISNGSDDVGFVVLWSFVLLVGVGLGLW